MSSLLKRVSAATTKAPSSSQEKKAYDNSVLLPYSIVCKYLQSTPLVLSLGMKVEDVHVAMVRLHSFCTEKKRANHEDRSHRVQPNCLECGSGWTVLDHRNGNYVCSHCGVCSRGNINVDPEFQEQVQVTDCSKRKRGIKGVPKWLQQNNRALETDERIKSSYWEELQSLNTLWCNLGLDEMYEADCLLDAWKASGGDTRETRMVAVLLYMRIRHCLPEEAEIRSQLQKRKTLNNVDCGPSLPTFKCTTCDRLHHTKKNARFCKVVNKCAKSQSS